MSEWKKVKLGDVVSIKSGLSYKSEFIGQGNNLLLGMGCVSYKENFLDSGVRPYSKDCDSKYLAAPGDLVLATRQQSDNLPILAMPAIIPDKYQGKKIIIGTNLYRVENNSDIENKFLFFVLKSHDYVNYIRGVKTGTTVQMVSKRNVEEYHFLCPPKETRKRIVSILSRYESLIDNYRKQIKLLEEAAQRLYKEWFVDLHFPGHENTKIVDGVPEGWEKKKLVDMVDVQYGYAFDGKLFNSNGEGMPILRIRNIPDGITSDYTTEEAQDCYIVHNGDIVVGMDGIFHINSWSGGDAYLVQRACSFRPKEEYMKGFIFQAIQEPIKFFEKTLVGATVAHLGKKHIDSIELCIPKNFELYQPFSKFYSQRQGVLSQIRLLTEARDRLLPKLMNGEIKV